MKKLFFMLCFMLLSVGGSAVVAQQTSTLAQDVLTEEITQQDVVTMIAQDVNIVKDKLKIDLLQMLTPVEEQLNAIISKTYSQYSSALVNASIEPLVKAQEYTKQKDYDTANKLLQKVNDYVTIIQQEKLTTNR